MSLVAHFKSVFLERSETFIRVQLDSMPGFSHLAVCREFKNNTISHGIPRFTVPACDFGMRRLTGRMPFTSRELTRRGVSLVHAHFGKDGWLASPLAGEDREIPLVVSFYGRDASAVLRIPSWRRRFEHLFESSDRILVLSDHMRRILEAAGCPAGRILVHSFGIDTRAFPFEQRSLPASGPNRLLFVGRLVPKKGLHTALRALKMLPGCELAVAGDGPGAADAVALAGELGISGRVAFCGWKTPGEVAAMMSSSHVLLVPSETGADGDMEGTPTVIFEAMASGLPVVGTDHAGIPEQLGFGDCGSIVPEGDWRGMADAAASLLSAGTRRIEIARKARARVESCFDASIQGRRLEDLYRTLIGKGNAGAWGGR